MQLVKIVQCLALIAGCCAALTSAMLDEDLATISAFGEPLNAGLVTTVREELNRLINNVWIDHPASTVCGGCLINGWNSNNGEAIGRSFPVAQIDSALAGIPAELVAKVKAIAFANKVIFENFRHSINAPAARGHYLQYLGIARRSGTNVELALVRGEVVGQMVQKYSTRHVRTCGKILWWTCCCRDYYYQDPRGYHADELMRIETAMRAETVRRLREKAQSIQF